jgi:hypothetical protein
MRIRARSLSGAALAAFVGLAAFANAARADDLRDDGLDPTLDRRALVAPDVVSVSPPIRVGALCVAPEGSSPCAPPCAPPPCAPCAPPPCDPCARRAKWDLTIGGWLTALQGDAIIRGRPVDVDLPLSKVADLVPYLEFTLAGTLGVDVDRWRFELSGFTLSAGDHIDVTQQAGIDATLTQTIVQPLVGYRVIDKPVGCGPCPTQFALMPYVGARYERLKLERSTLAGGNVTQQHDWWDPFVGVRASWDFHNRWSIDVGGDVGGFGVGSDFAWFAMASARYDFSDHVGVRFGWAFLSEDYSSGSGASQFKWDVLQQGPFIGVVFAW